MSKIPFKALESIGFINQIEFLQLFTLLKEGLIPLMKSLPLIDSINEWIDIIIVSVVIMIVRIHFQGLTYTIPLKESLQTLKKKVKKLSGNDLMR